MKKKKLKNFLNKKLKIQFIKIDEPQVCDCCKKASDIICIDNGSVLCRRCYNNIHIKEDNGAVKTKNIIHNPKLCVTNKVGVHCNMCNQVVTAFQKFQSGKCVCISCFNKMTDDQISKMQEEEYSAHNTKKYTRPFKIKFVQGGNP